MNKLYMEQKNNGHGNMENASGLPHSHSPTATGDESYLPAINKPCVKVNASLMVILSLFKCTYFYI